MSFKVDEARKAGYSDDEIIEHLSKSNPKFDTQAAQKAGYKPDEIIGFLNKPQEPKEGGWDQATRTISQVTQGLAEFTGPGMTASLVNFLGTGESLAELDELEERLPELKKRFPHLKWPEKIDREKYMEAVHTASNTFPTVANIGRMLEEQTGVPLEPKSQLDRFIRFSSSIGSLKGGGIPEKTMAGLKGGVAKEALEEAGLPEPAADALAAYYALRNVTKGATEHLRGVKKMEGGVPEPGSTTPPGSAPPSGSKPPPPPPPTGGIEIRPVSPGESPPPSPSDAKLTTKPEYLKSDYELNQEIQKALSPLEQEKSASVAPSLRTTEKLFAPVSEELNEITPHRVIEPNLLGRSIENQVKEASNTMYRENTKKWNEAMKSASVIEMRRPQLAGELERISDEISAVAKGGEAKLENFADRLLKKLSARNKFRPISNAELIKAIQQARVGYDYRFTGGVQGHRVNEFINAVEKELLRTAGPEERRLLESARQGTRDWATRFKNPSILPFRNEKISSPQKSYGNAQNPDVYNILSPILETTPRGRTLNKILARNMLEKTLEPYLLAPKKMNPAKLERDLAKFEGIIPEDILNSIRSKAAMTHEEALKAPEKAAKPKTFYGNTERETVSKIRSIEGLHELKKELTAAGRGDLYDQIARTQGIDLLFGGQMDVPMRADRIRKMLNGRNERSYLKETLGEENIKVLDEVVAKNELEKRLSDIEKSSEASDIVTNPDILIKGASVVKNLLKGNILTAVKQARGIFKHIKKQTGNEVPDLLEKKPDVQVK